MPAASRTRAALSPFLAGDPLRAGPEVTSIAGGVQTLGLDPRVEWRGLPLAPAALLIHGRTDAGGRLEIHWARLVDAPALGSAGATEFAVILVVPLTELGLAARLAGALQGCFGVPGFAERARAADSREALVRALAAAEPKAGESRLDSAALLALLGSGPAGLTTAEAARRLAACGENRLERIRGRSLVARFLEQFWSFFAVLLWVGGGLALLAGMPELGWAIFAVILVNGVFSFFQEYRAERAVEALQELLPRHVTVLRDGAPRNVTAAEVVPGDLVGLEEGVQIPADGQLLEATELRVDQSALTGESEPVWKRPVDPGAEADGRQMSPTEHPERLFAATSVTAGSGRYAVTATGMRSEIGAVAHLTQSVPEEPSPLQREMARVTRVVTVLAATFGVSFFLLGVATGRLRVHEGFFFALGVIVANVPEGLLPTLTLALALGVQRMARQRSVLKRLSAVETLGATTVICTDKTGTLTRNRMTARAVWVSGRSLELQAPLGPRAPDVAALLEAATLASHATAEHGDPTEVALVVAGMLAGTEPEHVHGDRPIERAHPFDSFRKRMTLVRRAGDGLTAYAKGAPREMLALCTAVAWDGAAVPLTDVRRRQILADHDRLAAQGLRILAVASRRLDRGGACLPAAAVERELTLLGLVALWDPPRPEVADAVRLCRRAGIRVLIVTGDYGLTARAIAREIDLPVEKVVTGEEVEALGPEELEILVAQPGVLFARTSPAHKLTIVQALERLGEVVAVTGDGVNDAPALKAADIGVAMGQRGSDVAKEAAVMVITDDNFASIVAAVRLGRGIYANVGKFVTYIFASNVPELVPFPAFVFLGIPLPLTVMQILAVDLGTDLLPALALGAEPPEPGMMDRPPRPRTERLLGRRRLLHAYGLLGVAEAALALLAFLWTYWLAGWRPGLPMAAGGELYRRATTMTLAAIVAAQVGNVLACRTDRASVFRVGLFGNRLVWLGIAAEIGILLALIQLPPLARVFGLTPPAFAEWGVLLAFPPAVLGLEEARKWLVRQHSDGWLAAQSEVKESAR